MNYCFFVWHELQYQTSGQGPLTTAGQTHDAQQPEPFGIWSQLLSCLRSRTATCMHHALTGSRHSGVAWLEYKQDNQAAAGALEALREACIGCEQESSFQS